MLKKIVLFLGLFLAICVTAFSVYVFTSEIEFTEEQENRIAAAIEKGPTPQVGTEGFAYNNGVRIWYDVFTPTDSAKGSVVLIMGLSADALAWPKFFIDGLTNAGYNVIRLDNRGVGMTDWDAFDPENPYSLSDMAKDVLSVLDTLNIEKAHIAGVSMGGMIGQTLCIEHPERAASLISIMSSPWVMDPDLPKLEYETFLKIGINTVHYGTSDSEVDAVKMRLALRTLLMGSDKYELDIERIAEMTLFNLRNRNGYNPQAGREQTMAIELSGSRVEALKSLTTPTLVIHGKTDPLIPFEHGVKTAELIPNAQTFWLNGMGHIIPKKYSDQMIPVIAEFMDNSSLK